MTTEELLALLPIILTATASILVMLGIAVRRSEIQTINLTLLGLFAALASLPFISDVLPQQVTPLLIMDDFSLFFIGLILGSGVVVTFLFKGYFYGREGQNEELYLLLTTALLGAVVLVSSRHFAALFLGLETLSVSLFAMIAYSTKDGWSLEAGIKYLILSAVASAFILFGSALVYADVGSLVFSDMLRVSDATGWSLLVTIGFSMLIIGFSFKLSLVPFHMWTSDVYQGAPAPVTAFVATVSKGAVLALLVRYFLNADVFHNYPVQVILSLLAGASIIAGNLLALKQTDFKRLLAYSSIAHMGYLLIPFLASVPLGKEVVIESVTFYMVAYFITTLGAFGMVSLMTGTGKEMSSIDDYRGLFWKKPLSATLLTAMLLSLAGIPLTAGFIGKFYVFAAGVEASLWSLVIIVVIGSGIGLFYYLRVVVAMLDNSQQIEYQEESAGAWLALTGLAILLVVLGVYPSPLSDLIADLARVFV
ncbi:MAG: NADH-quinone oxidoreductase subunit N [Methylococcales bacterium]|nr:NADH-quinone oxidoreductase subunit N [Methylococcales bacterium]MEE2766370.1 NADH-quinone oxidoreductase subunit N [Pseudomonadota bacterium]